VRPARLAEDLARRDFTDNAMAVPLLAGPELIDPHGGAPDLERGVLRVLHERSFVDDPTRSLRAARYAARYGFSVEPDTEHLLREADLDTVSRERVEAELRKLAAEPRAREGFDLLGEWGLVALEAGALELIDAVSELAESEPWRSAVRRDDAILAAALGRGLESARELAASEPPRPSQAVAQARGHNAVSLALARGLGAEWLDRYVTKWRLVRLEIDGGDLLEAGIPEGPAIGRGLAAALRAKLDGEIAGREEELRVALAAARG
jgi:tRNA nucleotidyltransferase (CCA-adding enzyme)